MLKLERESISCKKQFHASSKSGTQEEIVYIQQLDH